MLQIQLQQHTNRQKTRKDKTGERLGGREGGGLDGSFFENRKQCPDFGKKGRDFIHL